MLVSTDLVMVSLSGILVSLLYDFNVPLSLIWFLILPTMVDSSQQFINYKSNFDEDLSKYFFKENDQIEITYIKNEKISLDDQFSNYHLT